MKKLTVILFVLFLIILFIFNINGAEYKPGLGIKIGASLATFGGGQGKDAEPEGKIAFSGGLFYNYPLSDYFSLQPELLYIDKDTEIDYHFEIHDEIPSSYTRKYLQLPLLLKINRTSNSLPIAALILGPAISFLLDSRCVHTDDTMINEIIVTDKSVKPVDYSFVIGLEFDLGIEGRIYTIDIRYDYGFDGIFDKHYEDRHEFKNRSFNIMLGTMF